MQFDKPPEGRNARTKAPKPFVGSGASVPRLQRSKGRWEVGHMNQIIREIKRQAAADKLDQSSSWA
jgi:hypothetical protein